MPRVIQSAVAVAFAALACLLAVPEAPGRSSCPTQVDAKLTPQERIVQRDIQAAIDEQIEELAARDLDAATHLIPKDFAIRLIDGATLDRDQAIAGMRQEKAGVLAIDADRTFERIECLRLAGKEAIVYTRQQYVRTVPDRKDGSPHEIMTSVRHRETWVYTSDGWVAKRIEELEQGPTFLDGEPYDPR